MTAEAGTYHTPKKLFDRCLSYLQLGWRFIARALTLGLPFLVSIVLLPGDDSDPIPIKKSFVDLVAGLSSQTMVFRTP